MPDEIKQDLTIKINPAYRARLETLKEKMDRSFGWLIERCLEAHLPTLEAEEGILQETPQAPASPRPRSRNHPAQYRRTKSKK